MEVTRYGIVGKLRVRVNANLKAPTLTELLNQKRNMHLASFRYLVAELGKELEELGRSEAAAAREGVDEFQPNDWRHKPTSEFIEHILSECRAVLRQHEAMSAEELLEDGAYRSTVAEALSVKEMGKKKFMLWLTGGPQKLFVMRRGLKQSYRDWVLRQEALLASMPREEDRRAAALELCRSVGLLRRSVDEVNVFGETPLFDVAADHERSPRHLMLLVYAGADVRKVNGQGQGVAHAAAAAGCTEALRTLVKLGAEVPSPHAAAEAGHVDTVEALVELKADVRAMLSTRQEPIHRASIAGHVPVIEALVRLRADPSVAAKGGYTPLLLAAENGRTEAVRALVRLGAQGVGEATPQGTPLQMAERKGFPETARALRELGA